MKYKLLVLDVDGTLLNNQKEISPRTLAALLKVQQMGVHIVLASGRPTNGVMPIAEKLELNHYGGYILSYNGGQIINVQTGELLFEKRIDPEWIPYFEKKAKKNDFAIFTYHKDFILTDKPDNKYVIQEANLNKMQIVGVDNFAEAVDFPPCKCMLASDDEEALIGLENHWKKRLDGVLDAFRSEPYFLEVVPQFIDKEMMQMGKRNELSLLQNNMLMIDIQLHFAGIHPYKFIQRFVFQKIRVFMERIGQDDPPLYFRILKCPFHGILIFNSQFSNSITSSSLATLPYAA